MANKSVSLGNVASSQQLPTIDANAVAMPGRIAVFGHFKGASMATAAVPDTIHVARAARSMYSLSQSGAGSCRFAEQNAHIRSELNDILLKIPQKSFGILQQSLLKTEKFEKAVVIHFAIVVPAARHNFDGSNLIQICRKAR